MGSHKWAITPKTGRIWRIPNEALRSGAQNKVLAIMEHGILEKQAYKGTGSQKITELVSELDGAERTCGEAEVCDRLWLLLV